MSDDSNTETKSADTPIPAKKSNRKGNAAGLVKAREVRKLNSLAKMEAKIAEERKRLAPKREALPDSEEDEPEPEPPVAEPEESNPNRGDDDQPEFDLVPVRRLSPRRFPKPKLRRRTKAKAPTKAEKHATAQDELRALVEHALAERDSKIPVKKKVARVARTKKVKAPELEPTIRKLRPALRSYSIIDA